MHPEVPTEHALERKPLDRQGRRMQETLIRLPHFEQGKVPLNFWHVVYLRVRIQGSIGIPVDELRHPQVPADTDCTSIGEVYLSLPASFETREVEGHETEPAQE